MSDTANLSIEDFGGLSGGYSFASTGSFNCTLYGGTAGFDISIPAWPWDIDVGSIEGQVIAKLRNFGAALKFKARGCAYSVCSPTIEVGVGTNGEFTFPIPVVGNVMFDLW